MMGSIRSAIRRSLLSFVSCSTQRVVATFRSDASVTSCVGIYLDCVSQLTLWLLLGVIALFSRLSYCVALFIIDNLKKFPREQRLLGLGSKETSSALAPKIICLGIRTTDKLALGSGTVILGIEDH